MPMSCGLVTAAVLGERLARGLAEAIAGGRTEVPLPSGGLVDAGGWWVRRGGVALETAAVGPGEDGCCPLSLLQGRTVMRVTVAAVTVAATVAAVSRVPCLLMIWRAAVAAVAAAAMAPPR